MLRPFLISILLLACSSVSCANGIVWAGISFIGDYDQQTVRYPYASRLLPETDSNGQALLEAQLSKVLAEKYSGPLMLLNSASGTDSGPRQALAFAIASEEIEEIRWGSNYLYIYRVLSSVLVFDIDKKLLVASYPAMVQFQDTSEMQRSSADHLDVFKSIYSAEKEERSIFYEWVDRLAELEIQDTSPMYLGVRSVTLEAELATQIPDRVTRDAYETGIAQLFESIVSEQHGVSLVPYTTGQAVGQAMPLSFQDARVFQLQLPEMNFVFDLSIEPFKHLEKKKGKSVQHAFGAFMTLDFSLAATNKKYLSARFKQVNTAVFNENESVHVDIWQAQQTALRNLMVGVTRQISERDNDMLSKLTKDEVSTQLKHTEEKIALCK